MQPDRLESRVTPATLSHVFQPSSVGPQLGAEFGSVVAISPTLRVVGAPETDINGVSNVGQAFVYDAANTLIATLQNPSSVASDYFGYSVAIGGKYIAVGEYRGGADGVVHVYDTTSGSFPSAAFTLSNPSFGPVDDFGAAVAISGNRLVVGAPAAASSSKAMVYDLSTASNVPLYTFNDPISPDGNYGWSVAISGAIVVIGDYTDDVGAPNAGSAYVYDLNSPTPTTAIHTLNNPTPASNDQFGHAVAVSGATVLVGAFLDDTSAADAGAVYRYNLSGPTPTVPNLTITSPGGSPAGDRFGNSLSLDGNTLCVGVTGDSRSAYLFNLAGASPGVPTLTVTDPIITAGDEFGRAVALSGNLFVVGSPNTVPVSTIVTSPGTAFVYDKTGLFPTVPIAELANPTPSVQDSFGASVALSSKYLVVGAPMDSANGFQTGSAYFYDVTSATPTTPIARVESFAPTDDEQFGFAVAHSGNLALVGAPNYDDGGGIDQSGRAYLYDLSSPTPSAVTKTFTNPTPQYSEYFGYALAMEGNIVVIAAPRNLIGASTFAGTVYVYDLNSLTPTTPVYTLDNPTPGSNERFGDAVAISGTRVIVGAPHNVVSGIGDIGSVYVYDLSGPTPTTPTNVIDNPSPNVDDTFGQAVAISGQKVLIGAPYERVGTTYPDPEPGAAYLYDLASPTPTTPVYTWNNPQVETGNRFGISAALSSSYAVVGIGTAAIDESMAVVYDVSTGKVVHNLRDAHGGSVTQNALAIIGNDIALGVGFSSLQNTRQGAAFRYQLGGTLSATASADSITITDTASKANSLTIFDNGVAFEISDANEQFIGAPLGTTLSADGKKLTIPHSLYKVMVEAAGGNDTITIANSFSPFSNAQFELKGGGGTNTLRVTGNPELLQATLNVPTTGSLTIYQSSSFGTFNFTGMTTVLFDTGPTDIEFFLPTAAASTAFLEDDGTPGNSRSQLRAVTNNFQTMVFNDAASVSLYRGKAADVVTIDSMPDYSGDLTVGELTKLFSAVDVINKLKLSNGDLELYGVAVSLPNANSDVTTRSLGSVRLQGNAVSLAAGASVTADIACLFGDTIALDPASSMSLQAASFGSYLGNRQMDVGGPDSATHVGLTDAELDTVAAGNLALGSVTDIVVSSKITRSTPTNIQLIAENDIVISGANIVTNGTLLLVPDSNQNNIGSVQPTLAGADAIATTISFNTGSRLRIALNGPTVDAQYTQLKTIGATNLTGADLVLFGSHVPGVNETYTIVSATSVTGAFNGLPDGKTAQFNGRTLRINYTPSAAVLSAVSAQVASVIVNNNAAQRSRVTSVTVVFDQAVTLPTNPADAFLLTRQGDNKSVTLAATTFNASGNTGVVLTFTGGAIEPADMGTLKSLADGRYTLRVLASQVNGGLFDGDGNGAGGDNFVLVGDTSAAPKLYRLFGDATGDGVTDLFDFVLFRSAYGANSFNPPYDPAFDFNGDGNIDLIDFVQFRARMGIVL